MGKHHVRRVSSGKRCGVEGWGEAWAAAADKLEEGWQLDSSQQGLRDVHF